MLKLANQKLGLEHAVMRTGEHTNRELTATGFAKQERTRDLETAAQRASQIEQLLKSGAKLLLSTEQDSNAAAFGQSSIEEILEHYSESAAAEGEAGGAAGGAGKRKTKSTFSQATMLRLRAQGSGGAVRARVRAVRTRPTPGRSPIPNPGPRAIPTLLGDHRVRGGGRRRHGRPQLLGQDASGGRRRGHGGRGRRGGARLRCRPYQGTQASGLRRAAEPAGAPAARRQGGPERGGRGASSAQAALQG